MTRAVILDGRDIGLAQQATVDVLEHVLAGADTNLATWALLEALARRGVGVARADAVAAVARRVQRPAPAVEATVDDAEAAGHVRVVSPASGDPAGVALVLTPAGTRRHRELRSAVDHATDQLFTDIPRSEQRAAQRVLAAVTLRAERWLRDHPPTAAAPA